MNDKFSAQIRQYLLSTADERPADGQLEAVIKHVDATAQRAPLVARLTWVPGRIGPLPTSGLRFGLVAIALLLAAVVTGLLIGASPSPRTVFEGTWTSVDPGDGSSQSLIVGSGTSPSVRFVDDLATGMACQNDVIKIFTADGTGTVGEAVLVVVFSDGGGCGLRAVEMGPNSYTYDTPTDTLVDDQGLTWLRVRGAVAPTRGPVTEPPATAPTPDTPTEPPSSVPSDEPNPSCIQIVSEALYTANAGTLPVGVLVPASASEPWSGDRDGFALRKRPCDGIGSPEFDAALVGQVFADACHWKTSSVDVPTAFDAAKVLRKQAGHETLGPIETMIGSFKATRYDFSLPGDFDLGGCDLGVNGFPYVKLFGDTILVPGANMRVYVAEVDGVTLVVSVSYFPAETPQADVDQIDEILASLRVDI